VAAVQDRGILTVPDSCHFPCDDSQLAIALSLQLQQSMFSEQMLFASTVRFVGNTTLYF